MSTTLLGDLGIGLTTRDPSEDKMEQVRELVLGDFRHQWDARVVVLENRVAELEARNRELELALHHRIDALQTRIDAVAGTLAADRRNAFEEIAQGLQELGERVRRAHRV